MTTLGAFTYYQPTTPNTNPQGIIAGPDGNLWFTENTANKVAKVTTTGTFTEYPLNTGNSAPAGITAGPDGNLWFTEANKVARLTTAGVITDYPVTASSGPIAITAGSDGNLWFTENSANKIGRVTTAGVVTEYSIPTANSGDSNPQGITAGPDGNIWFTETIGNHVGKVTILAPPLVTASPSDQTVAMGATATFTSAASGAPLPTVQWQVSTNGGTTFSDVAGATSSTLTIPGTTLAMSGNKYHAVFTNSGGTATSNPATLTVQVATCTNATLKSD